MTISLKNSRIRGGKKKPARTPKTHPKAAQECPVSSSSSSSLVTPSTPPESDGGASVTFVLEFLCQQGIDLEQRVVTLEGELTEGVFSYIDTAFSVLELTDPESPITLRLYSPGGDVHAGFAIISRMKQSPCDIITEVYSSMSMASLIAAAGDKRRLSKWGTFMLHTCSYGVQDRHNVIKNIVRQADAEERKAAHFLAEHSKKPMKFWLKLGYEYDAFLSPEETLEFGLMDEVFGQ